MSIRDERASRCHVPRRPLDSRQARRVSYPGKRRTSAGAAGRWSTPLRALQDCRRTPVASRFARKPHPTAIFTPRIARSRMQWRSWRCGARRCPFHAACGVAIHSTGRIRCSVSPAQGRRPAGANRAATCARGGSTSKPARVRTRLLRPALALRERLIVGGKQRQRFARCRWRRPGGWRVFGAQRRNAYAEQAQLAL